MIVKTGDTIHNIQYYTNPVYTAATTRSMDMVEPVQRACIAETPN